MLWPLKRRRRSQKKRSTQAALARPVPIAISQSPWQMTAKQGQSFSDIIQRSRSGSVSIEAGVVYMSLTGIWQCSE